MAQEVLAIGKGISATLPALFAPDPRAAERTIEFFTAQIRNPNTRKAYARAAGEFAAWCAKHGIVDIDQVRPVHIAAYVEGLQHQIAAPSVKLRLAAIRMLFDWLVVGQVVPVNPASSVRGPKHSVKKGKTPVLSVEEARALLDTVDITSPVGLGPGLDRPHGLPSPASGRLSNARQKTCISGASAHGCASTKVANVIGYHAHSENTCSLP